MNFPGEDEIQFHRAIEDLREAAYEQVCAENRSIKDIKKADPPYGRTRDGKMLVFRFKLPGGGTKKDGSTWVSDPPKLVDSRNKVFTPDEKFNPGNGTLCRIAFKPRAWFVKAAGAGVTLRLCGVQILQYKPYDPAAQLGFTAAVEPGFVFEPEPDSDIEQQLKTPESGPPESESKPFESDPEPPFKVADDDIPF
jgi:hypothetical protein